MEEMGMEETSSLSKAAEPEPEPLLVGEINVDVEQPVHVGEIDDVGFEEAVAPPAGKKCDHDEGGGRSRAIC